MEAFHVAQTNRSIRTIKAELEYLCDASVITPATLSDLLSRLPEQTALHAPISVGAVAPPSQSLQAQTKEPEKDSKADPPPSYANSAPQQGYYAPQAVGPTTLCQASALYAYSGADAGDLTLHPGDVISVTEYTNSEWWTGRNTRTGQAGIFPRSYVRVEEKSSYGNMPMEVAGQSSGPAGGEAPSKGQEMGKKFGKKLGNAAIFGAGASIGANIVNGIF
ncbi:SH3 domain-containing protein [Piedraia hortae CBS 480.64]|uniref:SH3 domain-containing protein n=1 Tax=Piedraia hortae CBS 480.64 TaxID=1314780 RepID=A0A6A7C1G0_9PEZI|nr:SH3 domain-containing protein [Piedraia hortae CBS 480.64]